VLIGLALLVGLIAVPLTGGSLDQLSRLRFAATPAIVGAIVIQVVVISVLPGGVPWLHRTLHLVSYALAAWFVWANRRLPGVPLMALGGALNLAAIIANGGVMPASRSALRTAGLPADTGDFANSAAVAHPHLAWLGDVFATPAGLPFSNVFSVGDVVLVLGAWVGMHAAARQRPSAPNSSVSRRTASNSPVSIRRSESSSISASSASGRMRRIRIAFRRRNFRISKTYTR
jgi:hypothetical protein